VDSVKVLHGIIDLHFIVLWRNNKWRGYWDIKQSSIPKHIISVSWWVSSDTR